MLFLPSFFVIFPLKYTLVSLCLSSHLLPPHLGGKNTVSFLSIGCLMGTTGSYTHVVGMCFFLICPKIEFYESKQNDMLINMDVCRLDNLLSHVGPIVSWWNLVISQSGDRERIKGKWEIPPVHPVKCFFFLQQPRWWLNIMHTTKILNKTWSDKRQTCRKYQKGQKEPRP